MRRSRGFVRGVAINPVAEAPMAGGVVRRRVLEGFDWLNKAHAQCVSLGGRFVAGVGGNGI